MREDDSLPRDARFAYNRRMFRCRALPFVLAAIAGWPAASSAQLPDPPTRTAAIEQEQAEKAKSLHPYVPNVAERVLERAGGILAGGGLRWHPFFESAYPGGGFTLGAGYRQHVSPYNLADVRASYTFPGYKRVEAEFVAPRVFRRRGVLTALGGWREATQVDFYGVGTDTPKDARTNFSFKQPYGSVTLLLRPTRRHLVVGGGVELSQWSQRRGDGRSPSVETVYTPRPLARPWRRPTYLHSHARPASTGGRRPATRAAAATTA